MIFCFSGTGVGLAFVFPEKKTLSFACVLNQLDVSSSLSPVPVDRHVQRILDAIGPKTELNGEKQK